MKRLLQTFRHSHVGVGLVALMACVAHLGYSAVFESWMFLIVVGLSVAAAVCCHHFVRRYQLLLGQAALIYVVAFVVVGIAVTQWPLGVGSFQSFSEDVTQGWASLLSSQIPTALSSDKRAVVFASAWLTAVLALELDHRLSHFGFALIGALVGLLATSLLAPEASVVALIQGPVLVGLTLVLAAVQRTRSERTRGLTSTRRSFQGPAKWALPALLLGLIGLLGAVAGPRLPFAESAERFDLRQFQENPWDPLVEPSPLSTIKAFLKDGQEGLNEPLFTVRSEVPITRWTQAVMATYNGVVWQVADPVTDTPAQFVPIDGKLPNAVTDGYVDAPQIEAEVTIEGLTGPWLPHPGRPWEVRHSGTGDLRANLATGTLARPSGLQIGQVFEIRSSLHAVAGSGGIGGESLAADESAIDLTLVPSDVTNLAAELVAGFDVGGPQVAQIRDAFVVAGFYDISEATPPGHGFQDIAEFIGNPERLVGYEEQYAASAAVLARVAELPVRVVTGFVIPESRYENGQAAVLPSDAVAWIEVNVADTGWVPVDVTPDRSREPSEDTPGRVVRSIAVPNEPPPPPPPIDSDRVEDLEEDEEEDEEEAEEEPIESQTLLERLLNRPELVAVGVGVVPMVGLGFLAAVTIALKSLRRRRRRSAGSTRMRVVGAWSEFVDRFEEAGYDVPVNATPRELAAQISRADVVTEPGRVEELARLAVRAAFSSDEPDQHDVDRAWVSALEASADTASQLGAVERLRGACDPRPLLRKGAKEPV